MSTIFQKDFKNMRKGAGPPAPREPRCPLCRGELYPGDPYFELEEQIVCEDCIGRYARRYFAHLLRQVGRGERQGL